MNTPPAVPDQPSVLQQLFAVRREEWRVLGLSLLYFLLLMASYFILRPIRDQMGMAGGVRNLPWLFTATLLATLLVSPLFSLLVSRMPRRRFVALSYRLLILISAVRRVGEELVRTVRSRCSPLL